METFNLLSLLKEKNLDKPIALGVNASELSILTLLANNNKMYGNQIVKESDGYLKRGTIYLALSKLIARGFVEEKSEPYKKSGLDTFRKFYTLTGEGHRALYLAEAFIKIDASIATAS